MPKRNFTTENYRFGFNGKEKDDEVKPEGKGNSLDYGARIYDSRLGRWMSTDPLEKQYANLSSYNAFENDPTYFKDKAGKDASVAITNHDITISTTIYIYGKEATTEAASKAQNDIMGTWNKGATYTDPNTKQVYNVKFDIKVQVYAGKEQSSPVLIPESWNPSNTDNFVEVKKMNGDNDPSHVTLGDEGVWDIGDINKGWTPSHEFAHMLGLKDQYVESKDKNGNRVTVAREGWKGNIMAEVGGKLEQKNIDAIVSPLIPGYISYMKKRQDAIDANDNNNQWSQSLGLPNIQNKVPSATYTTKIDEALPKK